MGAYKCDVVVVIKTGAYIHGVLIFYAWVLIIPILRYFLFSLDMDKYKWTGIGDEGATALADPRVIKNFKTLE